MTQGRFVCPHCGEYNADLNESSLTSGSSLRGTWAICLCSGVCVNYPELQLLLDWRSHPTCRVVVHKRDSEGHFFIPEIAVYNSEKNNGKK